MSKIISETCQAIYTVLKEPYLAPLITEKEWSEMPEQFEEVWKMPHAISCIDGKNIKVEWPELSGTLYCIYKGFYSIALMAICDTNYCFTWFDLGKYGSNNDSDILTNSDMGKMFDDQLNVPADCKLSEHHEQVLPYF